MSLYSRFETIEDIKSFKTNLQTLKIQQRQFQIITLHKLATNLVLNKIHQKMHTHLSQYGGTIEAIFFCPHGPDAGCECRKPKSGLFKDIAERLHISLRGVTSVGDRPSRRDGPRDRSLRRRCRPSHRGRQNNLPPPRSIATCMQGLRRSTAPWRARACRRPTAFRCRRAWSK